MEFGGSGLSRMTHVKLMVLPMPTKTSLPPRTVVLGSIYINDNNNKIYTVCAQYYIYTVYACMYGCSKCGRRHWRPTSNDILRVETYGADIHNIHSGLNHLADVAAGQRKIHFCVWVVYQFTYVASIINMGLLTHYKVQPVFITLTFLFVEIFKLYFRKKKKKNGRNSSLKSFNAMKNGAQIQLDMSKSLCSSPPHFFWWFFIMSALSYQQCWERRDSNNKRPPKEKSEKLSPFNANRIYIVP